MKQELRNQRRETCRKNKAFWNGLRIVLIVVVLAIGGYYGFIHQWSAVPQKLLERGTRQEAHQQLSEASKTYQKIVADYPHSAQAEEALYRIGKLWQYDLRDVRQALLSYLTLEHDYPQSQLLHAAQEEAARIFKYSLRDYSQAIVYYQQLYQDSAPQADQYLYEIADCYFHLENYTQARIELENLLELFPESQLVDEALYRKGGLALLEKRYTAAQADWTKLVEDYPQSRYRSEVEYNLASLLEEQGKLHDALQKYRGIEDFSRPDLLREKIEHLEKRIAAKE